MGFAPVTNSPPGALYAWPRRGLSLKELGPGVWKGSIQWASLKMQYSLKIGGQSQQVRCDKSLTHIYKDAAAATATWTAGNQGVPIGWDGRTVHGVSIYVPQRTWTESVEIPVSQYSFDYEDQVDEIDEAPVNQNSFRGYDPGEVRFVGLNAQLSAENPDFVTATYDFERIANRSVAKGNAITIDGITNIEKDGWDYLDVIYAPEVDTMAQKVVPKAQYVLIHRMYDRSDFAKLKIGTDEALPVWQG